MWAHKVKITRRQLRRIIKEEGYYSKLPKWHVDGQPWPGSVEDLAHEQGRTWGHGEVVDKKGFKSQVARSRNLATGTDGSPLKLTETQLRRIIRETILQEQVEETLQAEWLPINHPLLSPYFDQVSGAMKGRPRDWFSEYISYTYETGDANQRQSLALYFLPSGQYTARVNGSYQNTLSGKTGEFATAEEAIEAALNSSPSGMAPTAAEKLVPVGEQLKPTGMWHGQD